MATQRITTSPTRPTHQSANNVVTAKPKGRALLRRRVVLVLLICLCIWPLLAWSAAQLLIVKSELPVADAIVVLSGSSTYLERADWAAKLYRGGRAPVVILTDDKLISGWNGAEERNPYFYELAAKELQKRGVPAEKIRIISQPAVGTYYESLNVREYATSHKLRRLLIVTSAYHSRRALWSMRRACEGTEMEIGVDGPSPGWQTPSAWTWWMHRWGWKVVAGEYLKMIYYWVRY
ncbi:MAG: YdcF family protein [Acidobacteriota bacterium]|nr:YdcF family protein [Acidobacteriota bacterium]